MVAGDYALPTQLWMVRDTVRAEVYRSALRAAVGPADVVLDVGAGSGILSLFAAQAGARQVIAVEPTGAAAVARRLAAASPWADRIEVLQADARTVQLPERADVLVSEWMGFFAIEENLLAIVLDARDRLLKPGGAMLPASFRVRAAPVEDRHAVEERRFWESRPYGLDLRALADATPVEPQFGRDDLEVGQLLAPPAVLWERDCTAMPADSARGTWRAGAEFACTRAGDCTGLAIWFDAGFPGGVQLSTAPGDPLTHWGTTLLPVRVPAPVVPGTPVAARVACEMTLPGHSTTWWGVRTGDGAWQRHGGIEDGEQLLDDL